jgi:glucosamine-6-phosphate deaminase
MYEVAAGDCSFSLEEWNVSGDGRVFVSVFADYYSGGEDPRHGVHIDGEFAKSFPCQEYIIIPLNNRRWLAIGDKAVTLYSARREKTLCETTRSVKKEASIGISSGESIYFQDEFLILVKNRVHGKTKLAVYDRNTLSKLGEREVAIGGQAFYVDPSTLTVLPLADVKKEEVSYIESLPDYPYVVVRTKNGDTLIYEHSYERLVNVANIGPQCSFCFLELGVIEADLFARLCSEPSDLPFDDVMAALNNDCTCVREAACWALGRIRPIREEAVPNLTAKLADVSPWVRSAACRTLGEIADGSAIGPLTGRLTDPDLGVQADAREALMRLDARKDQIIAGYVAGLASPDWRVRASSIMALGRISPHDPGLRISQALRDENGSVRREAAKALGRILDPQTIEHLVDALTVPDKGIHHRDAVVKALVNFGGRAVEPLSHVLDDSSPYLRHEAVCALGEIGDRKAVGPLIPMVSDEDPDVRQAAASALGQIGDPRVVETLAVALADPIPSVGKAASRALSNLGDPRGIEMPPGMLPKIELPYVRELCIASPENFAQAAAQKVGAAIRELQKDEQKQVTIVFAAGNTMVGFLQHLVLQDIEWSRVQAFQLDEYKGLPPEDECSFAYFLNFHLFSHVPIPRENIHYINGAKADLKGYMEELKEHGGADIVILSVGMDGHLALNEPPKYSSFTSRMQEVELTESTLKTNEHSYPGIRDNPFAYTFGMADIFEARQVFFLANNSRKAEIVQQALKGPIVRDVPASMLQTHPNVTAVLDTNAAQLLREAGYILFGADGIKSELVKKRPLPSQQRVLVIDAEEGQHIPFASNLVDALRDRRLGNAVGFLLLREGMDVVGMLVESRPSLVVAPVNYPFIEGALKTYGRLFGVDVLYYDPLLRETELNCFVPFSEADLERTLDALNCHRTQIRRTDYAEVTRQLCYWAGKFGGYLGWPAPGGEGRPCANPFMVASIDAQGNLTYHPDRRYQVLAENETPQKGFTPLWIGPRTTAFIGSPHPDDDVITNSGLSLALLRQNAEVVNMVMYLCKYGVITTAAEEAELEAKGMTDEDRGELRRPEVLQAGERLSAGLPGRFEVKIWEDLGLLDRHPAKLADLMEDPESPEYQEMFEEAVGKVVDYLLGYSQRNPDRQIIFIAPHHEDSHPTHRCANAIYVEAITRFCRERGLEDTPVVFYLAAWAGGYDTYFHSRTNSADSMERVSTDLRERILVAALFKRGLGPLVGELAGGFGAQSPSVEDMGGAYAERFRRSRYEARADMPVGRVDEVVSLVVPVTPVYHEVSEAESAEVARDQVALEDRIEELRRREENALEEDDIDALRHTWRELSECMLSWGEVMQRRESIVRHGRHDLHIHTNLSDAPDWVTPECVIHRAQELGVTTLAASEHNNTQGSFAMQQEARRILRQEGVIVDVIPGAIELSLQMVKWDIGIPGEVHIRLACAHFGIPALRKIMEEVRQSHLQGARSAADVFFAAQDEADLRRILQREFEQAGRDAEFARLGLEDEDYAQIYSEVVMPWRALSESGRAKIIEEADRHNFAQAILEGGQEHRYYRPLREFSKLFAGRHLLDAVDVLIRVRQADPSASIILCHIWRYTEDIPAAEALVRTLAERGLIDGIEAEYSSFGPGDEEQAYRFAREYNLMVSGGSDSHDLERERPGDGRLGFGVEGNVSLTWENVRWMRERASGQYYQEGVRYANEFLAASERQEFLWDRFWQARQALAQSSVEFSPVFTANNPYNYAAYYEMARIYRRASDLLSFTSVITESHQPKFDLTVSPESLFPVEEIERALQVKGEVATLSAEVKVISWQEDRINIRLVSSGRILAHIYLGIADRLRVTDSFVEKLKLHLPEEFKAILWNDHSTYEDRPPDHLGVFSRIYNDLNPRAQITTFVLDEPLLQRRGVGTVWYQKYIEPYLIKCGFRVAAVEYTCAELGLGSFWQKQGFSNPIVLNYGPTVAEHKTYYYFQIKALSGQAETSPPNHPGAGMIPAISYIFEECGISLRYQAVFEQILFWGFNLLLVPALGGLLATVITWSLFIALHFLRTNSMPQAPPLSGILSVAFLNAVALGLLFYNSTAIFTLPFILAFILATFLHDILNRKSRLTVKSYVNCLAPYLSWRCAAAGVLIVIGFIFLSRITLAEVLSAPGWIFALGTVLSNAEIKGLIGQLQAWDEKERQAAARRLSESGDRRVIGPLEELLLGFQRFENRIDHATGETYQEEAGSCVRMTAAGLLTSLYLRHIEEYGRQGLIRLEGSLSRCHEAHRYYKIASSAESGHYERIFFPVLVEAYKRGVIALEELIDRLGDERDYVRICAARALENIDDPRANYYSSLYRGDIAGIIEESRATPGLLFEALGSGREVRQAAAGALSSIRQDLREEERQEFALWVLVSFIRQGDVIHGLFEELHQDGFYPDAIYNRAITAHAARRGWIGWHSGGVNVISYGLLEEAGEEVEALGLSSPANTSQLIPLGTQIELAAAEPDEFGFAPATLGNRAAKSEALLLYQPGYEEWRTCQSAA